MVLCCRSINLLVLLQRQEGNRGMNTQCFVTEHFVQLLLCHVCWRNYTQPADMAAGAHAQTHNQTEMGPVLGFFLKKKTKTNAT